MRKRQRNPMVITNVFYLAKVGVEGSNPFTRSKIFHKKRAEIMGTNQLPALFPHNCRHWQYTEIFPHLGLFVN